MGGLVLAMMLVLVLVLAFEAVLGMPPTAAAQCLPPY